LNILKQHWNPKLKGFTPRWFYSQKNEQAFMTVTLFCGAFLNQVMQDPFECGVVTANLYKNPQKTNLEKNAWRFKLNSKSAEYYKEKGRILSFCHDENSNYKRTLVPGLIGKMWEHPLKGGSISISIFINDITEFINKNVGESGILVLSVQIKDNGTVLFFIDKKSTSFYEDRALKRIKERNDEKEE
jgi:hypothetical protein